MAYTAELHWRVYDDNTGEYVEVRPDSDCLDMVEIAACDRDGKDIESVRIPFEQAEMLNSALTLYLEQMRKKA